MSSRTRWPEIVTASRIVASHLSYDMRPPFTDAELLREKIG
jgi:hypothetical protein